MKLEVSISKNNLFVLIGIFIILGSTFVIYATAVNDNLPWHSASQVKMIDGSSVEDSVVNLQTDVTDVTTKVDNLNGLKITTCTVTISYMDCSGSTEGCKLRVDCDNGNGAADIAQYGSTGEWNPTGCFANYLKLNPDIPSQIKGLVSLDNAYLGRTEAYGVSGSCITGPDAGKIDYIFASVA